MPDELIEKQAWLKVRNLGLSELDEEIWNEVKQEYTYSNLPENFRYKRFVVTLVDEDIEFIKKNVILANEYGNNLLNKTKL